MKKFEHFYEKINGWSDLERQGKVIQYFIENYKTDDKITIAEIGIYLGRATSIFNVELSNNNIDYDYYAIDHFLGSVEHQSGLVPNYDTAKRNLEIFSKKIHFIPKESVVASSDFDDCFFDFIYIDGSHDYNSVTKDIQAWFPKLKNGGIIAGDDYHETWPEVVLAVDNFFGSKNFSNIETQWLVVKDV
jgi:predicted O-methyltransferase YrrM